MEVQVSFLKSKNGQTSLTLTAGVIDLPHVVGADAEVTHRQVETLMRAAPIVDLTLVLSCKRQHKN